MRPGSRLNSWRSWHLLLTLLSLSLRLFGVVLHEASRPATFFSVSPLFDPGRRLTGRRVGTPFVPTPSGVSRRAGAVKDGRRPPQGGARKACVLDGSEHRGTSPAMGRGLLGLSALPAPPLGPFGVPLGGESRPAGVLENPHPCQLGFCRHRKAA